VTLDPPLTTDPHGPHHGRILGTGNRVLQGGGRERERVGGRGGARDGREGRWMLWGCVRGRERVRERGAVLPSALLSR
jgi:hypothetical protein